MSRLTADLMQPENSHGVMSTAPILILLPAPNAPIEATRTAPPVDGDTRVLGLDLLQRTIIAARRAGYSQIFSTVADWAARYYARNDPLRDRLARTAGRGEN